MLALSVCAGMSSGIYDLEFSLLNVFPFQELDCDTFNKGINTKRCILITWPLSRQGYKDEKLKKKKKRSILNTACFLSALRKLKTNRLEEDTALSLIIVINLSDGTELKFERDESAP